MGICNEDLKKKFLISDTSLERLSGNTEKCFYIRLQNDVPSPQLINESVIFPEILSSFTQFSSFQERFRATKNSVKKWSRITPNIL